MGARIPILAGADRFKLTAADFEFLFLCLFKHATGGPETRILHCRRVRPYLGPGRGNRRSLRSRYRLLNELDGSWFDGIQSRGAPARLRWSAVSAAVITCDGLRIDYDRTRLKIASTLPGTPTRIALGEKESFVTEDNAGIAQLRDSLVLHPGLAGRLERNMPAVITAAAAVVALLAGLTFWGVPALAARVCILTAMSKPLRWLSGEKPFKARRA